MAFDSTILDVVLATDENYAEFVSVVLVSLLDNNPQFRHIKAHLLVNNVSDRALTMIQESVASDRLSVFTYDISNLRNILGIEVPPTIALTAYARLFVGSILPQDIEKLLYLDCDIVVNDSISDFWSLDLHENWIAGCLDTLPNSLSKTNIGLERDDPYFNSGVLLINLSAWRKENLQTRFLQFLLDYGGHVHHHDQGIINAVCNGHKVIVPLKFNLNSNYLSHQYALLARTNTPFYSEEEVKEACAKPAIIHYTQGFYNRPWIRNSEHPFSGVFDKYHKRTEWRNNPKRKDPRPFHLRLLSWEFLHAPLWCYNVTLSCIQLWKKIK